MQRVIPEMSNSQSFLHAHFKLERIHVWDEPHKKVEIQEYILKTIKFGGLGFI